MKNYKFTKELTNFMILLTIVVQLFNFQQLRADAVVFQESKKINNNDVRLQDDFYTSINREWINSVKLDNGYVSYGTFEELCGRVNNEVYNIIQEINDKKSCYESNSEELKLLNLYSNYLNIKSRNKSGTRPIDKYIKKIDKIKNIDDLKKIFYDEDFMYFQPLVNIGVGADYKNSSMNILYFGSSNLILGNSLYYKNESYENIRKEYIEYLTKLHKLYGENKKESKINAEKFYSIEKNIADNIPTYQDEANDNDRLSKTYNVLT